MDKTYTNSNKISTNAASVATTIYNSLIGVGIILLICTLGYNSVDCSIAAYSILIGGFSLLCAVLLFKMFSNNVGFLGILFSTFPMLIMICILGYSLYIYTTYRDRISRGNITSTFATVSKTSIGLILLEIYILILAIQKDSFKKSGHLDGVYSLTMLLFQLLNIILLFYLGLNLKYFSTDG